MSTAVNPLTFISAPEQQHMLFLFLPIKKGTWEKALAGVHELQQQALQVSDPDPDLRASTGVHFFLFYALPANTRPPINVTSFQTEQNKDLLVIQAIYDADFAPYIGSFVQQPKIAAGLDLIVKLLDESNIPGIDPDGPNSANFIIGNGGVAENPDAFNCLLMKYNFANPVVPGVAYVDPKAIKNPIFGATFPGLTVGKILQYYPNANQLWPYPPATNVAFGKSVQPQCNP